jgi:hypothetical protein
MCTSCLYLSTTLYIQSIIIFLIGLYWKSCISNETYSYASTLTWHSSYITLSPLLFPNIHLFFRFCSFSSHPARQTTVQTTYWSRRKSPARVPYEGHVNAEVLCSTASTLTTNLRMSNFEESFCTCLPTVGVVSS